MQNAAETTRTFDPVSWYGRTFPALFQAMEGGTLQRLSLKPRESKTRKPPIFLCLTRDGRWLDVSQGRGGDWSIAWRVLDAQFWGVPQRRRRIALIADFGGECAPEILFERESLCGDSASGGSARQGASLDVAGGADGADQHEPAMTCYCLQGNGIDRADTAGCNGKGWTEEKSYTLNTMDRPAVVYDARGNGSGRTASTLTGDHQNRVTDYTGLVVSTVQKSPRPDDGTRYIVRRLTPLECERLQGFPDGWTDIGDWTDAKGRVHQSSDSGRYKALGNSIALPPWAWVLRRLNLCCVEHTMASLFDGIGGFPLLWEGMNGRGSCLWASEIDEFPIAVTKKRFGL